MDVSNLSNSNIINSDYSDIRWASVHQVLRKSDVNDTVIGRNRLLRSNAHHCRLSFFTHPQDVSGHKLQRALNTTPYHSSPIAQVENVAT
jgi:hypothetical protein